MLNTQLEGFESAVGVLVVVRVDFVVGVISGTLKPCCPIHFKVVVLRADLVIDVVVDFE